MTRRVHGSSAVALNEVSRATFVFRSTFLFLPSFAGLIVAPTFAFQGSILGPTHQRNYAQGKAHHPRFRFSFSPRRQRERKRERLFFFSLVIDTNRYESVSNLNGFKEGWKIL